MESLSLVAGYTPMLINGHGGLINGIYQTAGKRSPNWHNGILFEGVFNRWVVNRVIEKLTRLSVPFYNIVPEQRDVSLETRVKRTNRIFAENKKVYTLEIHANAGNGEGIEGFTSPGFTKSDIIANVFLAGLQLHMPNIYMRFDYSDGDRDKEKRFYTLVNTKCPAFLLECGFMDNHNDYDKLWSEDYIETLVESLVATINKIYRL